MQTSHQLNEAQSRPVELPKNPKSEFLSVNLPIQEFCDQLDTCEPASRRKSIAALSGAFAAELVCAACRLSLRQNDFAVNDDLLTRSLEKATAIAERFLRFVELRTPIQSAASTDSPETARNENNIEDGGAAKNYERSVRSLLAIASACHEVLLIAHKLIGKSDSNFIVDLGIASQQALAGMECAIMGIEADLQPLADATFKAKVASEISAFLEGGRRLNHNVYKICARQYMNPFEKPGPVARRSSSG
jgi:formiminotetrahydrofolate cyclodeaminase